jgi:4-hydroxybenzoate polyprenyltransferase
VLLGLVRLVRPAQWAKSAFVLVGPVYALADPASGRSWSGVMPPALVAAAAFALASSACYIVNDLVDAPRDRFHPRKKHRPIASGAVTPQQAASLACVLILAALGLLALLPRPHALWTAGALAAYAANVTAYSLALKRAVMADVISLSGGFVLRVLGGCAAAAVVPSTWLLNVTFFLAMFLAFCKRLGERRLMNAQGVDASAVRGVQKVYTDDLLRMSVVVTAVATLVTYALYIQAHEARYLHGFNLLWLTLLPATYGLLRAIVLVERADYDDPTEMAARDWRIQAAAVVFVAMVGGLVLLGRS